MSHDFSTHNIAFSTPWITIYEKDTWYALNSPSGRHGGGTLILDSLGRALLIEIYRHPINKTVLEIPRGGADPSDDSDAMAVAIREASEETGIDLSDARTIDLGIIHPDDGILAYENRICAAILPHPFSDIEVDKDETQGFRIVPLDILKQMILDGEINDSHTIAAIFRLTAALHDTPGAGL